MTAAISVHIADVGLRAPRLLASRRMLRHVDGLRGGHLLLAAPLSANPVPAPSPRRVALLGFWESPDAAEQFSRDHPLAERFDGGWRAITVPIRLFGEWPGIPSDLPHNRTTPYDGPVVVLTLGRLRLR